MDGSSYLVRIFCLSFITSLIDVDGAKHQFDPFFVVEVIRPTKEKNGDGEPKKSRKNLFPEESVSELIEVRLRL